MIAAVNVLVVTPVMKLTVISTVTVIVSVLLQMMTVVYVLVVTPVMKRTVIKILVEPVLVMLVIVMVMEHVIPKIAHRVVK